MYSASQIFNNSEVPGDNVAQALENQQAAAQPGLDRRLLVQHPPAPVALVAGGTVTIPGPAAGFVRFLLGPIVNALDLADAPIITAVHQPTGFQIRRAAAVTAGSFLQPLLTQPVALAAGQSIDVSNTAAAGNDAVLWYPYYDLPDAEYTCVAVQLTDATKVTVIPAAPAGFFNRLALAGNPFAGAGGGRNSIYIFNDDTVAARIEVFIDGAFLARVNSTPAAGQTTSIFVSPESFTTNAVQLALILPVTTRPVYVFLCYETLPLP